MRRIGYKCRKDRSNARVFPHGVNIVNVGKNIDIRCSDS